MTNELAQLWNWLNVQIRELDTRIDEYRQLLKALNDRPDLKDQARQDMEGFYNLRIIELHSQQRGYEKTMVYMTDNEEWRKKIWMLE